MTKAELVEVNEGFKKENETLKERLSELKTKLAAIRAIMDS